MTDDTDLRHRPWAVGAASVGLAMLAVYVAVIVAEGNNSLFDVLPWALLMTIGAIGAFSATQIRDRLIARNVMIGTAALFGVLGFVSILSIGIGFIAVAVMAVVAAARLSDGPTQ